MEEAREGGHGADRPSRRKDGGRRCSSSPADSKRSRNRWPLPYGLGCNLISSRARDWRSGVQIRPYRRPAMTRLAVPPHARPLDSAAAGCSAVGGREREVFRLGIEISAWVNSSSPGQAHGPMPAPASVMSKTQASRWSRFGTFGLELRTRTRPLCRCAIWTSGCRRMGRGWPGSPRRGSGVGRAMSIVRRALLSSRSVLPVPLLVDHSVRPECCANRPQSDHGPLWKWNECYAAGAFGR